MSTQIPDLSPHRQHAEAVTYGKLLALREVLDDLHDRRSKASCWYSDDYLQGYDAAVADVKRIRLGVEKA